MFLIKSWDFKARDPWPAKDKPKSERAKQPQEREIEEF
jgi:hypothetical protein